jgi:ATP-dependent DNA helicase DinG
MVAEYQQGVGGAGKPKPLNLRAVRARHITPDKQPDFVDAYEHESLSFPDFPEVVAALSKDGIAGRMYPLLESRQEQIDMAVEINDAFAASRHLAVEAGTGVGKSLAYLLPAVLAAQRNDITIGIGTKTNTLTDQLMNKELPLLAEALEGTLRYTALKGYEHYLCLHKLEAQLRELTLEPYEVCVALAWVATHSWGDFESMNFYWKTNARWILNARSLDCAKRKCRFYPKLCYVHGARVRARSSHIVVTNHALLFRDSASSGALLPPLRYLILDEAQGVESEARRQLSVRVASEEVRTELAQFRRPHAGLVAQIRRNAGSAGAQQEEVLETLARFELLLMQAESALDGFVQAVCGLLPSIRSQQYASTDMLIDSHVRETAAWGLAAQTGRELHDAITTSVREGRSIVTAFEQQDESPPNVVSDFGLALMVWSEFAASLELCLGDSVDNVYYCANIYHPRDRGRDPHVELVAANIELGGIIAQNLLEGTNSVVFTSATLAAGNDFAPFTRAVGLDALGAQSYQAIQLPSSFDLESQMRIFIASDIAAPTEDEYRTQLEEFLRKIHLATRGGVLTLFTNRRDLQILHESLKDPLAAHGLPLLAQGHRTNQKHVRERFIQEPDASLFATKSFWEGFDAMGQTLRCVVIPRLPFVQPTDPLALARKTIDPRSWDHYVLPEALIELKQAVGRLIRSATDRGCVIITDSRAAHARYAQKVQQALPVIPETATQEEILQEILRYT